MSTFKLTIVCAIAFCTTLCADAQVNLFAGKEFYVAFLQNEHKELADSAQQIHITSERDATVRIKSPFSTAYRTYSVQAGIPFTLFCPKEAELRQGSGLSDDVYHVLSDENVFVTAHSTMTASSDGYAVVPVRSWSQQHRVLTTGTDFYRTSSIDSAQRAADLQPRTGQFCVISNRDDTRLDITPTVDMAGGFRAGERFVITLDKGDVWHGYATPYQERNSGDLSGTLIQSNYPVGVVSGHLRSAWPISNNYPFAGQGQSAGSKDHLIEMMPGIEYCGISFTTVPYGVDTALSALGDAYKIVATAPNTHVTYTNADGVSTVTLDNAGESVALFNVYGATEWTATKPVYFAHIAQTAWFCGKTNTLGDPSLLLTPAHEQWVKNAICVVPSTHNMQHYVLTVVCDSALRPTIDGAPLSQKTSSTGYTQSGRTWYRCEVQPGYYNLEADGAMGIWVTAFGEKDSYAFPVSGAFSTANPSNIVVQQDSSCRTFDVNVTSEAYLFDVSVSVLSGQATISDLNLRDTTTTAFVGITEIDISQEFLCEVRVTDINGTENTTFLRHEAMTFVPTERVNLPVDVDGPYCTTATIHNTSNVQLLIEGLWFLGDEGIDIENVPLPLTLPPGETLSVELCMELSTSELPPSGRILARVDCVGDIVIPVGVRLDEPAIAVSPYRFSETLLSTERCSQTNGIVVTNTGNTNILLEGLDCTDCAQEFVYTGPVFPLGLRVGEQRVLEFCFTPSSPGEREATVSILNDEGLEARGQLSGFGVQLMVATQDIVLPTTRVGRSTQGSISYTVTSNTTATLLGDIAPSETYTMNGDVPVSADGSFSTTVSIQASPTTVGDHVAEFTIRAEHPLTSVTTVANITLTATLPDIVGTMIDLGSVPRGEHIVGDYPVFESIGNELVQVDSVVLIGTDAPYFAIQGEASSVDIGESWLAEIQFSAPSIVGTFEALALMYSDAGPGYDQYVDTTIIRAEVFSQVDSCLDVTISGSTYACVENEIQITIRNTCDFTVTCHSVTVGADNADIDLSVQNLPVALGANEEVVVRGTLRTHDSNSPISVSVACFDDTGIQRGVNSLQLPTQKTPLTIGHTSSSDVLPGQVVQHIVTLEQPHAIADTLIVTHNFDAHALNLLRIEIGNGEILRVNAPDGNIVFNVPITEPATTIKFYYQALLSHTLDPVLQTTFTSPCFASAVVQDVIDFNPVCLQNIRTIDYGITTSVLVAPNPVQGNTILMQAEASENVQAELKLLNMNGKVVYNWKNFSLKKGKHSYNLSPSALLPGLYALIVRINQTISTQYIIIN